jgi:glutamate--cysteine ligase
VIELPVHAISTDTEVGGFPLTELEAERLIGTICFKTGPPGIIGTELEWLVSDVSNPSLPVPFVVVREILEQLKRSGAMPGGGLLTLEPGGQVELSSAPATSLPGCVAAASDDMLVLREAFGSAGLALTGHGLDLHRPPSRVLDLPRYAAMEQFFDRNGPWGRLMMCSTASVQVCVDAGIDGRGTSGYPFRWRLMHALGPVLVAAFANSPLRRGEPTGWKCTRQLVWSRLDPYRTRAPIGAEPYGNGAADPDPRQGVIRYAMDADVLCLRQPEGQPWTVPAGLTFRDWLRGSAQGRGMPRPTADDLTYHLSTLFPPVRARGHLELRMIDAQPGDGWIVPVALVAALADDPVAADAAMAATEPVWHGSGAAGIPPPRPDSGTPGPWLRAARLGPGDQVLARAITECFAAADAALARSNAPEPIRSAVAEFAERYPRRGRCPADDILDNTAFRKGQS